MSRSRYAGRHFASPIELSCSSQDVYAEAPQQLVVELDQLRVDGGVGRADDLGAELPVLAVAAVLRPVVAVHRRDRVELHRLRLAVEAVLEVGAQIGAVASGRSVSERPPRSSKVYISFWTTSEPSPEVRWISAVSSNAGVWIRGSRRAAAAARSPRRAATRAASPGRMSCVPAALRTSRRAQLGEERVAGELGAERRRRAVAGVDDGLGREAVEQRADRVEQRLPVGARQVGAADGAREQDVAREERAVGVVGDVRRRVARARRRPRTRSRRARASRRRRAGRPACTRARRTAAAASRAARARPRPCTPARRFPRRDRRRRRGGRSGRA